MSRQTLFAALAALLGMPAAASAATFFLAETGNWTVVSMTNSCIAWNRPGAEYNHSPWNSLTIRAPKTGGFLIEVVFWPKTFEEGSPQQLSFSPEGRLSHDLEAKAIADYGLATAAPIPDELVRGMTEAKFMTVKPKSSPISLGFSTQRIGDVVSQLDHCRNMIAKEGG